MKNFNAARLGAFLTMFLICNVMLTINVRARVGDKVFPGVTSFNVESSVDNTFDNATLEVPRILKYDNRMYSHGESLFKRGDQVQIECGYDGNYHVVFAGYVNRIEPASTITFKCDNSWLFKQSTVTKGYKSVSLSGLLADVMPVQSVSDEADLGALRFTNLTPAEVLAMLKDQYGLYSYLRGAKLFVGIPYRPEGRKQVSYVFGENVIDSSLEYMVSEDLKLQVKAIGINPSNPSQRVESTAGDAGGEVKTVYRLGLDANALKALAERVYKDSKYDGFKGSINTFGEPFIRHGDCANLVDNVNLDRNGKYLVKAVNYSFSVDGGLRQRVTLDQKIS
jgi:hypothetical protein